MWELEIYFLLSWFWIINIYWSKSSIVLSFFTKFTILYLKLFLFYLTISEHKRNEDIEWWDVHFMNLLIFEFWCSNFPLITFFIFVCLQFNIFNWLWRIWWLLGLMKNIHEKFSQLFYSNRLQRICMATVIWRCLKVKRWRERSFDVIKLCGFEHCDL